MLRKKPLSKDAACLKMADLCARAEHCSHEIAEKLRKMHIEPSDAREIIEYLEENQYIDNRRFANAFVRDKVRFSGWGVNKIRGALIMKRIDSATIHESICNIDEEEYSEACKKAALSKARTLDLRDYNDRNKLYRYLLSRGFETSVISKIIGIIQKI